VVARRGQGQEPWYLLTSEPLRTVEDAWQIVYAYARRWQIEMSWRYGKSELAMESPRLWDWERRQMLLLLATPTPSCSPCSPRTGHPCGTGSCAIGATARESEAEQPRLRSTACTRP
jgi:hypothetical protein